MARQKKHNPERRSWRGKSHREGGKRVRDLRALTVRADLEDFLDAGTEASPGGNSKGTGESA